MSKTINIRLLLAATALLLLAACSNPATRRFTVNGVEFKMIRVDGGTFNMGATPEQGEEFDEDELPVHRVRLSTFYIAETEVTQALWKAVMGTTVRDLSASAVAYHRSMVVPGDTSAESLHADSCATVCGKLYGEGPNYPIYYVSWNQAQEFCQRLSEMTGRQFCLPTEAQWSIAARGGTKGKNYMFSGSNNAHEVGWLEEPRTEGSCHPVKQKLPNEIGIYDMTGNVWEWCSDWYGPYGLQTKLDPTGPEHGTKRVERGSSWRTHIHDARTSDRECDDPDLQYYTLGFRIAMKVES